MSPAAWKRLVARSIALTLCAASLAGAPVLADPPGLKTLAIGSPAPDFALPGVDGKTHRLADYADAKLLMVVFTCNHCPTAQAYEDRIIKMHNDYQDKGVALVAISPNDALAVRLDELGFTDLDDSLEAMKQRAKDKNFPFPYLYDGENQKVSFAYGVLATPQVFLFDQDRKLRYVGRIDDGEVKTPRSLDARNAVDALLANQPVPVESTRVFGCSTKWSDKRGDARKSMEKWNTEEAELKAISVPELKKLAANDGKNLRVINVWATWCGPCVQEMPDLVEMHRMYRRRPFEMITLSLDEAKDKDQALKILREHHASMTNYLIDSQDKDAVAEALDKEWPGPIPYTVVIAPGGKVLYRKTGAFDALELKKAIVSFIGRTY